MCGKYENINLAGAIGLFQSFGKYSSTVILDVLKKGASLVQSLAGKVGAGLLNISASFGILKTMPIQTPVQPIVTPAPPPVVVVANLYRTDTRKNNGFSVNVERKFLNLRSNLVVVKIVNSVKNLSENVYKGYMQRW